MTIEQFLESLGGNKPPAELNFALAALWWDAKDEWAIAHESAQQDGGPGGSWVHAYLHRKEGDASNAGYWYRRAGRSRSRSAFEEEWLEITRSLLAG